MRRTELRDVIRRSRHRFVLARVLNGHLEEYTLSSDREWVERVKSIWEKKQGRVTLVDREEVRP